MASSDLGPLGSRDGAPVDYNWVLPGIAPLLLPWLIVLGLLALKANRSAAAWLIWLPIGFVMALSLALPLSSATADFSLDAIAALLIGIAATWLLANRLRRQHGFLTFLCVLLALGGFSLLAGLFRQSGSLLTIELLPVGFFLVMGALVTSVALSLDGMFCRHRYRPGGLYLWLFLPLVAIWLLLAAPFILFAVIASAAAGGERIAWSECFIPVFGIFIVALVNYAMLLPFLVLSSASSFYRERLKALLHVQPEAPPPLVAPPADNSSKT